MSEERDIYGLKKELVAIYRRKKRSAFDIMETLLESIPPNGIKRTLLANKAMVDYKVMEKYLKLMLSEKFVTIGKNDLIFITEKGKNFLNQYKQLKQMVNKV